MKTVHYLSKNKKITFDNIGIEIFFNSMNCEKEFF